MPINPDDVAEVCKWAEAFFDLAADDDEVSEDEQHQRDEGCEALHRVRKALREVRS